MKFTLAATVSLLGASSVVASPHPPAAFDLMSLRSASPIHFARVSAAQNSLFLNLPHQNAVCKGKSDGYATFYIQDEQLFLYSTCGETQQIFTDRSGMGQGKLGYITQGQSAPRYAELKGWKIDKSGDLVFKDTSLIACPNSIGGSWSVWVAVGVNQPGGNQGCLGFIARTLQNTKPVSCHYSK